MATFYQNQTDGCLIKPCEEKPFCGGLMRLTNWVTGVCMLLFLLGGLLNIASAAPQSVRDIMQSYQDSDFQTVAKLLEDRLAQLEEQAAAGRTSGRELYTTGMFLADTYAWKLGKVDEALKLYQKLYERENNDKDMAFINNFLQVFIAELYTHKGEYAEALEAYKSFLAGEAALLEKENDSESRLLLAGLNDYVKYNIDSLNLKIHAKDHAPLLAQVKLSTLASPGNAFMMTFLAAALVPASQINATIAQREGLAAYIRNSSTNFSAELSNYVLIVHSYAGALDSSADQVLDAYLAKYPESLYSLMLRALFYNSYKNSGQEQKAAQLLQDMEKITGKRKMALIVESDKRFSSPEATWELYKKALIAGDIDLAMECHLPGERQYREVYTALGKEEMKKIAEDMRPIEKVTASETSAKYRIKRLIEGNDITFYITFVNIDGEWKIENY